MSSIITTINQGGPIVVCMIGVSAARLAAIRAKGLPDPQVHPVRLLIDTGASNTNICGSTIDKFGIDAIGSIPVHTPSTGSNPVQMEQYDVNLYFRLADGTVKSFVTIPVIRTDFKSQGDIDGLLGRDILSKCTLSYLGESNICSISF